MRLGGELHLTKGHEAAGSADGSYRWLTAGKLLRFLVALLPVPDLLLCAKHLFVAAMVAIVLPGRVNDEQWNLFSPEF